MTQKNPAATQAQQAQQQDQQAQALLHTLLVELFQTEESYVQQCRREAARNTDPGLATPVAAMVAAAGIAESSLARLRELATARGIESTEKGKLLGALFSSIREHIADRAINSERSWRLTVMGMRHGIDVLSSVREVARTTGDAELVAYCDDTHRQLKPLVDDAATACAWFARHPAQAMETATS